MRISTSSMQFRTVLLLRSKPARSIVYCRSHPERENPFDLAFQEELARELGVKAQFEEEAEEDWEDVLEETEDPWMREPAAIEFAGETISIPSVDEDEVPASIPETSPQVPSIPLAAGGDMSSSPDTEGSFSIASTWNALAGPPPSPHPASTPAHPSSTGAAAYGSSIPRCSADSARESQKQNGACIISLSRRGPEVWPGCEALALDDLGSAEVTAKLRDRPVRVLPVCDASLSDTASSDVATNSDRDRAADRGTSGGIGSGSAVHGSGDAVSRAWEGGSGSRSKAEVLALQACIRLKTVLGHPDVALVQW